MKSREIKSNEACLDMAMGEYSDAVKLLTEALALWHQLPQDAELKKQLEDNLKKAEAKNGGDEVDGASKASKAVDGASDESPEYFILV